MNWIKGSPYNLCGTNITSLYGGWVTRDQWTQSQHLLMDPQRKQRANPSAMTSCDESDANLVQRYDDDKLELTCFDTALKTAFFIQSRFGQVRSPFVVELKDSEEGDKTKHTEDDDYMGLAVDGEIYKVRGGKKVNVQVDPVLKSLRFLRRIKAEKDTNEVMQELMQYQTAFL